MPLAILVNGNSASASEILAGAVKDHDKGNPDRNQNLWKRACSGGGAALRTGPGLKFTIARYFTPSGVCIHQDGIEPDIEVKLDEKYSKLACFTSAKRR